MSRFSLLILMSAAQLAAMSCKDCPPCPCADKQTADAKKAKAEANNTKAMEESDAGVAPQGMNAKPQEVKEFKLFGRAGFERVNVFEKPDMDSPRIGYLRKGARIMVGDPKYSSASCPGGWFQVPTGGFVCQGRGMLVGAKPRYLRNPPPEGNFDELDPYRHGFIRKDWTPSYKRLPTIEELWTPPTKDGEPAPAAASDTDTDATGAAPLAEAEILQHDPNEADGGVDYYKYTKKKFRAVAQLLSRGFWVSIGERLFDDKTHKYYYKTVKGQYVPGESVHLIQPPEFQGYPVTGDTPLPAAIVTDKHASFFTLRRDRFGGAGPVDRLMSYRVFETKQSGNTAYYRVERDRWLKDSQVAFFSLVAPPPEIKDKEKWIRVDLANQTLVAYEGAMPVYVTLVSTGIADSEETATPRGKFHILFKHLTDDMAGEVGDDEVYSVEDVPWVQYIHLNVALHGSFWHSSFGSTRSHGCINLSPADARWLFNWSGPVLPENWHGVVATEKNPGTLVIIEGQPPKKK
jgi:lipoprotein-anchoring transpeptidase ErfK/SrfK